MIASVISPHLSWSQDTALVSGPATNKSLDVTQHPIKPSRCLHCPRDSVYSQVFRIEPSLARRRGRSLTLCCHNTDDFVMAEYSSAHSPHCLRSSQTGHFVMFLQHLACPMSLLGHKIHIVNAVKWKSHLISLWDKFGCQLQPGQAHVITSVIKSSGQLWQHHLSRPGCEQYLISDVSMFGIKAPARLPVPGSRWSQISAQSRAWLCLMICVSSLFIHSKQLLIIRWSSPKTYRYSYILRCIFTFLSFRSKKNIVVLSLEPLSETLRFKFKHNWSAQRKNLSPWRQNT